MVNLNSSQPSMINNILSKGTTNRYKYKLFIHISGEEDLILDVVSVNAELDFMKAKTDLILVTANIILNDYVDILMPNLNQLHATLVKFIGNETKTYKYKCIPVDSDFENSSYDNLTEEDKFKTLTSVEFQLRDILYGVMKNYHVSGIYHNNIPFNVLITELSNAKKYSKQQNDASIYELLAPPSINGKKYENLTIPTGTNILDLPLFLQKKYGIYNGGINFYIRLLADKRLGILYPINGREKLHDKIIFIDQGSKITNLSEVRASYEDNTHYILMSDFKNNINFEKGKTDNGTAVIRNIKSTQLNRTIDVKTMDVKSKWLNEYSANTKTTDSILHIKYSNDSEMHGNSKQIIGNGYYFDVSWDYPDLDILIPCVEVNVDVVVNGKRRKYIGNIARVIYTYNAELEASSATIRLRIFDEK